MGGKQCSSFGFFTGTLGCTKGCAYDKSNCHDCGNGKIDGTEQCDQTSLGGKACKDLSGFDSGTLKCTKAACTFDTAGCGKCGDGKVNGAEQCETTVALAKQCKDVGAYDSGTLKCVKATCTFDATGCGKCGDGKVNGAEKCDGKALGGATCVTAGFSGGTLECDANCQQASSKCYKYLKPVQFPIATASGSEIHPRLVWNGSAYHAFWIRDTGVSVYKATGTLISSSGTVSTISGKTLYSGGYRQVRPAVASSGTATYVAWTAEDANQNQSFKGILLGSSGVGVSGTLSTLSSSEYGFGRGAMASDGKSFLVVWDSSMSPTGHYDVKGALVDATGKVVKKGIKISTAAESQSSPAIAFDGKNYLVVWGDRRNKTSDDVYGARVSTSGVSLDGSGFAIATGNGNQHTPALAFDGTNYLVVWSEGSGANSYNIRGVRVSTAAKVLDTTRITISSAKNSQHRPSVGFNGKLYLVAWNDDRGSPLWSDVYAARVLPDGTVLDPGGIPISTSPHTQTYSSVASDGKDFLVIWQDKKKNGNFWDIFGTRLAP